MHNDISTCPGCGQPRHFQAGETTLLQCSCGTVISRCDGGIWLPKAIPVIQESQDLLRVGATGKIHDKEFTILGRIRCWFDGAVYNYWTIRYDDGSVTWLGEGYGEFCLMRRQRLDIVLDSEGLKQLKVGSRKELLVNKTFLITSAGEARRFELEGEAWMPEAGSSFRVIEAATESGSHLAIFELLRNYLVSFDLVYPSFAEFHFQGLNEAIPESVVLPCGTCKKEITISNLPYVQSFVCPHCMSYHVIDANGHPRTTNTRSATDAGPDIRLGSTGKIKGIAYTVVGFALKEENNQYRSQWKEYVLHNRQQGYAFLSEYNGHFIFLRVAADAPVLTRTGITRFTYDGEPFELYNLYTYTLINAQGEFPYDMFRGGDTEVKEFISPPEMWSHEFVSGEEVTWFKGEHIDRDELKKEFDFPQGLPWKTGVGAIEPKSFINPWQLARMAIFGVLALVLAHTLLSFSRQNRVVLDQTFRFDDSSNTLSAVSEKFSLERWRSNLEFHISAGVNNSWFELNTTLVNAATGAEYSLEKGVEYYHGISEGESWSEGDTKGDGYLTQIPAGTYFIQVRGIRETPGLVQKLDYFTLIVTYDISSPRNLWFCVLILLVWPVIQYFRIRNVERSRWSNSPYTPYEEDQD